MTPVFAKVHHKAVGAGHLDKRSSGDRVGLFPSTRLAHGRNVIDVNA
jgi:hypothetical protein